MGFIDKAGNYYEGDQQLGDAEYVAPPGSLDRYEMDGKGGWQEREPLVPASVTPLQARLALSAAGRLAQVEQAAAAAGGEVLLAWQFSSTVERASPFVAAIAGALAMTDGEVDELFRQAVLLG